jgi:hypothetical protein
MSSSSAEVELCFNHCTGMGQPSRPALIQCSQAAISLQQSLSSLRFSLRSDQIGKSLNLREIKLAILKRLPRKFPRFSQPESIEISKRHQDRSNRRPAAMNVQFGTAD